MMTYSLEDVIDFVEEQIGKAGYIATNTFCGLETVEGKFVYDVSSVHETEHPYRVCDKALFLRVAPTKALVLGVWKAGNSNIAKHLLEAMRGRILDIQEEAIA